MKHSNDWLVRQLLIKSHVMHARLNSSRFLSGISGELLRIITEMLDWLDEHRSSMNSDELLDYLLVVKGLQKDCIFYQSVAKGIWE